ncbi:ADP-ribosylation factor-like protein 2-binding protein [Heterocephalus glaber]|uniref:ADP-ribosylation factor-like protein 2-binding protein n=1 Tax=Heterocephalus glaber TaxID=10181 RepID=G5C1H9_HETGA|nr:ADP-ribosylation factor-like protein 2-binding protein [Heterocephalus glaber]
MGSHRVEKYIEEQLVEQILRFSVATFATTSQHHKDEVAGDIFDILLTFTGFLAFKEMFLDHRTEKGRPRAGFKQWLGRDIAVQIIYNASFPEQSSTLGNEWGHSECDQLRGSQRLQLMTEECILERLTVLQPFIQVKYPWVKNMTWSS